MRDDIVGFRKILLEGFEMRKRLDFTLMICLVVAFAWHSSLTADDSQRLQQLLESDSQVITIPPGIYHLNGATPIRLRSNITVQAYGARFLLPDSLPDPARVVIFQGEDIQDFRWLGGRFEGHVFDPNRETNCWEPNANTRSILITTTMNGRTERIAFRDVTSSDMAGAVITVLGAVSKENERDVQNPARNVTVENCVLERSGKFMWDYGYLWQAIVWPEEHDANHRAYASKYFRNDLIRGPVRMKSDDDRVWLDNTPALPKSAATNGLHAICFYNDSLPANIIRGRQYYVIESTPEYIRIAKDFGGDPIRFEGSAGPNTMLISDLFQSNLALYAPKGSGPGKGAIDIVAVENVSIRGCILSALGDTMHIQRSKNVVFNGNQITGSRMGAFFIAEYCKNVTISGNTVDGTNGSRIMSVEKSTEDITIIGNTFRNGGRGSWINQPRNFILADNIFVNNTTKCERDPKRGRRSFKTGEYETYSELYFTTHEPNGRYGNVIVRGNIFQCGPHAEHAINFAPGGDTILVEGNQFSGPVRDIAPIQGCYNVTIQNNIDQN
jgi:hypothetical protein